MTLGGASIQPTGGTGSFGKRFVARMLEQYSPARLVEGDSSVDVMLSPNEPNFIVGG